MKNIKSKFKLNSFTYFLLFSSLCTGFFKNILLILVIVLVHELGHVVTLRHFEYEILKVEIYPFGGITKVNKPLNTPLRKEIVIASSGVFFQCLLYVIFAFLFWQGFIYEKTFSLFCQYNKVIFWFNLLPIVPLDGSILLHSLLEYFFSYKRAYFLYFVFSIIAFFLFVSYHTVYSLNNYMILFFLMYHILLVYRKRKYYQNRFFLERYLYEFPYQKIASHPYPNLDFLKKDTLHFFWMKDRYLHEKEFLKEYYKS